MNERFLGKSTHQKSSKSDLLCIDILFSVFRSNRQTNRHDYRNPRCAWAPRINHYIEHNNDVVGAMYIKTSNGLTPLHLCIKQWFYITRIQLCFKTQVYYSCEVAKLIINVINFYARVVIDRRVCINNNNKTIFMSHNKYYHHSRLK